MTKKRRRFVRNNFTPEWGNSIVDATVCKIDFLNQPYGDKLKSVFYCPSYEKPEGRMCVYWQGRCTVEIGDYVRMKGKFSDGIFLVNSYQIIKRITPPHPLRAREENQVEPCET